MKKISFSSPATLPQQKIRELRVANATQNFDSRSGFVYLTMTDGMQPLRVPLSPKALAAIEFVIVNEISSSKEVPSGGVVEDVEEIGDSPITEKNAGRPPPVPFDDLWVEDVEGEDEDE